MSLIYLIGMPGSGKTTLGRELAKEKNLAFVDMDVEIEKKEGMTIPEIFSIHGEAYFRDIERLVLHECSTLENTVISTGGGAPCFFDNSDYMHKRGKVVFIDVSPKEIVRRMTLARSQDNRPLLAGKSDNDLLLELESKRNARLSFYNKAHHVLSSDKLDRQALEHALGI